MMNWWMGWSYKAGNWELGTGHGDEAGLGSSFIPMLCGKQSADSVEFAACNLQIEINESKHEFHSNKKKAKIKHTKLQLN